MQVRPEVARMIVSWLTQGGADPYMIPVIERWRCIADLIRDRKHPIMWYLLREEPGMRSICAQSATVSAWAPPNAVISAIRAAARASVKGYMWRREPVDGCRRTDLLLPLLHWLEDQGVLAQGSCSPGHLLEAVLRGAGEVYDEWRDMFSSTEFAGGSDDESDRSDLSNAASSESD